MRLPTFSRVTCWKMRAPVPSRVMCTAGSPVWLSKPGCASLMRSPVSTTCFLTQHRRAVALDVIARCRTAPARRGRLRAIAGSDLVFVDHAHFERRGAAEDVLRFRRVLHAGQLHDDAVGALLLDDRLGHAQLVHAVAQRRDVLLQREVLRARLRLGLERADDAEFVAVVLRAQLADRAACVSISASALSRSARVAEAHDHATGLRARRRCTESASRAARRGYRSRTPPSSWRAPPSCRPAAGSARRRADRARDTSAARRSRRATAGLRDSRFSATT